MDSLVHLARKRPSEGPALEPAKRQATINPQSEPGEVCERCKSINWKRLCVQTPLLKYGKIVATLSETHEELFWSRCPMCRLLASIHPVNSKKDIYQLRAFSSRLSFGYDDKTTKADEGLPPPKATIPQCTVLYIVPKSDANKTYTRRRGWHPYGCIGFDTISGNIPKCGPRLINQQRVNYPLIQQWMKICACQHTKTCSPTGGGKLEGLRVIDCRTRSLIKAPDKCRYVAVSYVWGQGSENPSISSRFAPVIEDSISVVLSLGLHYIWVDKYCIDQSDPNKQNEIDGMDRIYSQAELTLIAAAGDDDRYGLPGLSRARKSQKILDIGSIKLIHIPPHTSKSLRSSTWASRGWTYQESVLSRRRLIFTDCQVSFLCNDMHCAESVDMPPEPLKKGKEEMDNPFTGFLPRVINSSRGNQDFWVEYRDIRGHIVEFSKRRLSYDSDALNAIVGIFNSFQRARLGQLKHIWGLPMKKSQSDSSLLIPLNWYHIKAARRREDFPSWSWSGWDGGVSITDPDIRVPEDCQIDVKTLSRPGHSSVVSLSRVMDLASEPASVGHSNLPKMIRITAKIIRISLQWKTWGNLNNSFSQETQKDSMRFLDGFHAKFSITKEISAMVYAYLDQGKLPPNEVAGLMLNQHLGNTGIGILLLEQCGYDYRRVGILRFRNGRGTEAGGGHIPHIVYVDAKENVLEEVKHSSQYPLWLHEAKLGTVRVV